MSEEALRHRYSNVVDSLRSEMETFRQFSEDSPQRLQVLTDLRTRLAALSVDFLREYGVYKNRLSELATKADEMSSHGGRMDATRATLSEEHIAETDICSSLKLSLRSDINMAEDWRRGVSVEDWRTEVSRVGQAN